MMQPVQDDLRDSALPIDPFARSLIINRLSKARQSSLAIRGICVQYEPARGRIRAADKWPIGIFFRRFLRR